MLDLGRRELLGTEWAPPPVEALDACSGRHQDSLAQKRRAVQARRRRSDAEIFAKFPLRIVPTYPGDDRFDGAYFRELLGSSPALVRSSLGEIFR